MPDVDAIQQELIKAQQAQGARRGEATRLANDLVAANTRVDALAQILAEARTKASETQQQGAAATKIADATDAYVKALEALLAAPDDAAKQKAVDDAKAAVDKAVADREKTEALLDLTRRAAGAQASLDLLKARAQAAGAEVAAAQAYLDDLNEQIKKLEGGGAPPP